MKNIQIKTYSRGNIIGVVVSVLLGSIVIVGLLKVVSDLAKISTKVKEVSNFETFELELKNAFRNIDACNESFKDEDGKFDVSDPGTMMNFLKENK